MGICPDTVKVVFMCLTAVVICAVQHRPRQVYSGNLWTIDMVLTRQTNTKKNPQPNKFETRLEFVRARRFVLSADLLPSFTVAVSLPLHAANWRVYDCNTTHKVFHISHTHTTHIY